MKTTKILEVTLRDGSYAIDFQFTAADTAIICKSLEDLGFDMIEVGHGIGLGASRAGLGVAAETDETYLKVTSETLKKAKWGMFCIPGIAKLDDINMAADYGMNFIRIGTNVTEVDQSEAFINRAKKLGMYVSSNLMKSYALEPKEFAQNAILTQKYGSDLLCIVDSAGGMLTSEMEKYFIAVQDVCDIDLGFHGHNNLLLSVANSLRAVELGAIIVDTSLQGFGRGGGNTPTEIFLPMLERIGINLGINPLKVIDVGEKFIKPLINKLGYDSIDIISGFAQFHSSYMGIIREFSSKYGIDPRRLILSLCEKDKVNAPRKLVEEIAKNISEKGDEIYTAKYRLDKYFGAEQTLFNE